MRDRTYIIHIQERVERIESFTREGREVFMASELVQDAVIRNFEVIGEAVKQLSPELRAQYPDVRWREIAGFRDVLIHNYIGVNLDAVWNITEKDLPGLKRAVDAIRREMDRT